MATSSALLSSEPLLDTTATLTRHAPITIAVDPVALVITECITVTSAMRKHPWWAQSSVSAILGGGPNQQLPLDTNTRRVVAPVVAQDEDEGSAWRWGARGRKGKEVKDNPLIAAFTKLRADLRVCRGMWPRHCFCVFLQIGVRSSGGGIAPVACWVELRCSRGIGGDHY
jgi:brefeldin A-resistance guanine nucleotide exchange factor 1